jgi:hypothetical protein
MVEKGRHNLSFSLIQILLFLFGHFKVQVGRKGERKGVVFTAV